MWNEDDRGPFIRKCSNSWLLGRPVMEAEAVDLDRELIAREIDVEVQAVAVPLELREHAQRRDADRVVGGHAHAGPRGERSAQSSHVGQLEQHVN